MEAILSVSALVSVAWCAYLYRDMSERIAAADRERLSAQFKCEMWEKRYEDMRIQHDALSRSIGQGGTVQYIDTESGKPVDVKELEATQKKWEEARERQLREIDKFMSHPDNMTEEQGVADV